MNIFKKQNAKIEKTYVVYTIKGGNSRNSMINTVTSNFNIAYYMYRELLSHALIDDEIRFETWENNALIKSAINTEFNWIDMR